MYFYLFIYKYFVIYCSLIFHHMVTLLVLGPVNPENLEIKNKQKEKRKSTFARVCSS